MDFAKQKIEGESVTGTLADTVCSRNAVLTVVGNFIFESLIMANTILQLKIMSVNNYFYERSNKAWFENLAKNYG